MTNQTELNTSLLDVARNGTDKQVIDLLSSGAQVDACDRNGETALHHAITYHRIENIIALISHGADVNYRHKNGSTALHIAAGSGGLDHVDFLVARGADIHVADGTGYLPLHWAAYTSKVDVMQRLIDLGCDPNAPIINTGGSSLHLAAMSKANTGILYLLEHVADINLRNKEGFTPLDLAVFGGNVKNALILIAYGAELEGHPHKVGNMRIAQMTPWQAAIRAGLTDTVVKFLATGDPDGSSFSDFTRPMLAYARKHKQPEVLAVIQSKIATQAIDEILHAAAPAQQRRCTP